MGDNLISATAKSGLGTRIVELEGNKILVLAGEVNLFTVQQFNDAIDSILESKQQHLIIDMYNVDYFDSTAINVLVTVLKRMQPSGGTIHLVGCKSYIDRIFYVTRISTTINLHQNIYDALEVVSGLSLQ